MELKVIARVKSNFPSKFGIPRQSGLIPSLKAYIIFEPEYRNEDALRGLAEFSHLWLIWGFSENERASWSPTIRPPRLGGNERIGVFASRSSFRPNALALSCVKLESIEKENINGTVLLISGADMMNGTPIYDIKPYLPFTDCIPNATGGFTDTHDKPLLQVVLPDKIAPSIASPIRKEIVDILAQDPRPAYQHDPERIYGFNFAGFEIKFRATNDILTVLEITKLL